MQYRKDKQGRDLSLLGYGCLRFTRSGNQIDTSGKRRSSKGKAVYTLDIVHSYQGNQHTQNTGNPALYRHILRCDITAD